MPRRSAAPMRSRSLFSTPVLCQLGNECVWSSMVRKSIGPPCTCRTARTTSVVSVAFALGIHTSSVGTPLGGFGDTGGSAARVSSDSAAKYFRSDAISDSHWAIRFKASLAVGGESRFQRPMWELSVAPASHVKPSRRHIASKRRLSAWRRLFASSPLVVTRRLRPDAFGLPFRWDAAAGGWMPAFLPVRLVIDEVRAAAGIRN